MADGSYMSVSKLAIELKKKLSFCMVMPVKICFAIKFRKESRSYETNKLMGKN